MITLSIPTPEEEDAKAAEKLVKELPKRFLASAVRNWYSIASKNARERDYWKTQAEAKTKDLDSLEKELDHLRKHVSFAEDEIGFKQHQIDILINTVDRLMDVRDGGGE